MPVHAGIGDDGAKQWRERFKTPFCDKLTQGAATAFLFALYQEDQVNRELVPGGENGFYGF